MPEDKKPLTPPPSLDDQLDAAFDGADEAEIESVKQEEAAANKAKAKAGNSKDEPNTSGKKPRGKGFASMAEAEAGVGAEDIDVKAKSKKVAKVEDDDDDEVTLSDDDDDDKPTSKGKPKKAKVEASDDDDDLDDIFGKDSEDEDDDDTKVGITPLSHTELQTVKRLNIDAEAINDLMQLDPKARAAAIRALVRQNNSFRSKASGLDEDGRKVMFGDAGSSGNDFSGTGGDAGLPPELDQAIENFATSTGSDPNVTRNFARQMAEMVMARLAPNLEALQNERQSALESAAKRGIKDARRELIDVIPALKDPKEFRKVWDDEVIAEVAKVYMKRGTDASKAVKMAIIERAKAKFSKQFGAHERKIAEDSRTTSLRRSADTSATAVRRTPVGAGGRGASLNDILDGSFDELMEKADKRR